MPPKQAPPVGAEGRAVRLPVDKKVRELVRPCLCALSKPRCAWRHASADALVTQMLIIWGGAKVDAPVEGEELVGAPVVAKTGAVDKAGGVAGLAAAAAMAQAAIEVPRFRALAQAPLPLPPQPASAGAGSGAVASWDTASY